MSTEDSNTPGANSRWSQPRDDSSTPWSNHSNAISSTDSAGSTADVTPTLPIYGAAPPVPTQSTPLGFPGSPAPPMPDVSTPLPTSIAPTATPPPIGGSPVSSPVLSGTYGADEPIAPPVPTSGGGRTAWFVAVVGAFAMLVGGGFFALSALGASGGGKTPEEAVDQMIAAMNDEDFLTFGEMLEPAERRTLVEPTVTKILPELKRLGVFSDEFDFGDIGGVDFQLTDVTYRVEPVPGHDDLVHIYFTGGQGSAEFIADDFPFGEAIRDRFGDVLEDDVAEPEPIADEEEPIVLIERNDRWYFSMWHTIGENARLEFDQDLPNSAQQPRAIGSDSPEEAVEQLMTELVDFDLASVIGTLDPEEAAALYRYSPLFLDDAQRTLDDAKRSLQDEGIDWSVSDMDFDVETDGDDAVVTIRGFTFRASGDNFDLEIVWSRDEVSFTFDGLVFGADVSVDIRIAPELWTFEGRFDDDTLSARVVVDRDQRTLTLTGDASGEEFTGEMTIDNDGCSEYSFRGMDTDESGCLEEGFGSGDIDSQLMVNSFSRWFDELPDEIGGPEVAAHKTDGEWFVSPTATVMNGVISSLQNLDQESFDAFLDDIEAGGGRPLGVSSMLAESLVLGSDFGLDEGGGDFSDFSDYPDDTNFATTVAPFPVQNEEINFFVVAGDGVVAYPGNIAVNGEVHVYNIDLVAGQTVGLTVDGAGRVPGGISDPFVEVRGPSGEEVAFNDDFDGLNSGLQFGVTRSGPYQIRVQDLSYYSGAYELTVEVVGPGVAPTVGAGSGDPFATDPFSSSAVIEDRGQLGLDPSGVTVLENRISSGQYDVWDIGGLSAGQVVTITLTSTDERFDPHLVVLDTQSSNVVADNDDAEPAYGLGALDSRVVLTDGLGFYSIEVHTLGDFGAGNYTLTVTVD